MRIRVAAVVSIAVWFGLLPGDIPRKRGSLIVGTPVLAAGARPDRGRNDREMLVTAEELQQKLDESGLRILDTRSRRNYREGHISGALHVDVAEWKALSLSEGGLRNERAWTEKVGAKGIGRDTTVVVYGDRVPNTARIWWLLKYVGADDVRILDGGWDRWTAKEGPVSESVPNVKPVEFRPDFQTDRVVDIGTVKESVDNGKLRVVDARSTGEYTGEEVRGERGGHIPGATHLEWQELLRENGRFKSPGELRQLFRKHGIRPSESTACY